MEEGKDMVGTLSHRTAAWSKWWLLVPVILLLVQISAIPYMDLDSVSYLSMARSLAEYGVMQKLGSPHLVYAVGYPTVLSGALLFGGDPFLTSSILNAVLGLIFLLGVWKWCNEVAPGQAVWISCLSVGNVIVLQVFRRPLSEPLFMALLLWSTLFLNQVVRQLPGRVDWVSIGMASILLCMLVATRQVGVFLVAGYGTWLGWLALQGTIKWRHAVSAAILPGLAAGLTLLAMIYQEHQTKVHAPAESHWDMLLRKSDFSADYKADGLVSNVVEGFRTRVYEIGRLLIPGMFGCYAKAGEWLNVNTLIYVPVAAICFFGWWRLVRRHADSLSLMVPFYFALYVLWPCDQGGRFFTPLLPVLFLSWWKGLVLFPRLRARWMIGTIIIAHAAVALGLWVTADLRHYHEFQTQSDEVKGFAEMLKGKNGQIGIDDYVSWPAMYLAHHLDRPVLNYDAETPSHYLIWPVNLELPMGYVELSSGTHYRLARSGKVLDAE